jgi:hypothetical protein
MSKPLKNGRQMVYGASIPPAKVKTFLDDPGKCGRIASVWGDIRELGMAVMMDLPMYCKKEGLDASAVVLALNRFITTIEVVKDQAILDRKNAEYEKDTTKSASE